MFLQRLAQSRRRLTLTRVVTRTTVLTLLLLAAADLVAWQLGGSVGAGVLAGFLVGASFTGLALAWQRHHLVHRPQRALQSVVEGFLFKLLVLLMAAFALRYIPAAAAIFDWRSFLVAFAAAAFALLAIGTADNLRHAKERRA